LIILLFVNVIIVFLNYNYLCLILVILLFTQQALKKILILILRQLIRSTISNQSQTNKNLNNSKNFTM
jgi:hypothetical protein